VRNEIWERTARATGVSSTTAKAIALPNGSAVKGQKERVFRAKIDREQGALQTFYAL
jgi:hypothetical protein